MPRISKLQLQLDKHTPVLLQVFKGSKGFPLSDCNMGYYDCRIVYERLYYAVEKNKLGEYAPSDLVIHNTFNNLGKKLNEQIKSHRQANDSTQPRFTETKSDQRF